MYLFLFLLIFACNDYGLKNELKTGPELVIYPESIEFGNLLSGTESGQEVFAVINAGDEDLIIGNPMLISNNDRFNLDSNLQENYVIESGGTQEFSIYYTPETYESGEAIISLVTNDEDESQYELPVTGFGDAPVMTVSPEVFDYGQISIGCDNEERITIRNDGNLILTINDITQMVTQPQDIIMEMGSLPALPWSLLPGQEVDFIVSYLPTDISYDESVIRIEGNDPILPLTEAVQYGEGDVAHWSTQTHIQEEVALLDVIFVIDNSGSMNTFQQELASQVGAFMNVFSLSGANYHLAAITTDEASFISYLGVPWIDSLYVNPVVWLQQVIDSVGIRGSGIERGIEMAKYALEGDAAPGGGFLRDSATLVIIYVSDEPDGSTNGWNSYVNFFDTFKPSFNLMKHFAVIGNPPSGCAAGIANNRNIQFGAGYYDMTQRYNGNWYSICAADWGQQMQNLANTVTTRKYFELDETDPIESTITVSVNGQITTNWVYDVASNTVGFNDDAIPNPGQTIEIEYAVWGCGE
jgi:hypothetical protein